MAEIIAHSVDELADFWAKAVHPFIAPIFEADSKGQPSPIASSVLVSRYERHYLLTAHHVTAPIIDSGPQGAQGAFYTFVPEQIQIGGLNHHVTDPFDLSMTEIPATPPRSLRLPQHLAFDVQESELCLLIGFPARSKSWEFDHTRHTLRPAPLSYLGRVAKKSTARFSVRFDRKHLQRKGRTYSVGKLNGISGGGAFVLRNDMPHLAGIIIEYHSRSAEIVCTSSVVVWTMAQQIAPLG